MIFDQGVIEAALKAKQAGKKIQGIIVVAKDAPYENVEDLAGLQVAFPAPAAFAATLIPLAHFKSQNIGVKAKYVSSHDSVYRAVSAGFYPAGGGVVRTFKSVTPEVRDRLRILWTSPGFTPHAIAAHPRVDAEVFDQVQQALASMHEHEQARPILQRLKIDGFSAAQNQDWDDVRGLNIDLTLGTTD